MTTVTMRVNHLRSMCSLCGSASARGTHERCWRAALSMADAMAAAATHKRLARAQARRLAKGQ